jgi:hypothetical protein
MEGASPRRSTKGSVSGRPQEGETAACYFGYINQVAGHVTHHVRLLKERYL